MNLMNGSLKGRLYEAEKKESLTEQERGTYRVAFVDEHVRDLFETASIERNYAEAKRN